MSFIRGNLDVTIALSADTCYFIRTGKCSLSIVTDYAIAPETKTTAADLLYCPRLYRAMRNRESMKPITVTPCECGHAEVVTGHQRVALPAVWGWKWTFMQWERPAKTLAGCAMIGRILIPQAAIVL